MVSKPSFDLKLDRAEKHLVDLEQAIDVWVDTHPYQVSKRQETQRKPPVYRLHFTSQPPDEIAILAADFLYNVHSGLNHLAAALVPKSRRTKTMFPILWEGVWNKGPEGEDEQRVKDRGKWKSFTKGMHEDAIALIKSAQPPDVGKDEVSTAGLAVINRLRNTDAHSKLPIVAHRLLQPRGSFVGHDGVFREWNVPANEFGSGFDEGAEIKNIPVGAMDVQVQ